MKVDKGLDVEVHYTGKDEKGEIFDSSESRNEVLKLNVGDGQIIQAFENGLIGLSKGDKKSITIEPEEGYGEVVSEAVQDMPMDNLPEGISVGDNLQGQGPNGQPIMAKVESINGTSAKIDFNHPLAGKTITFDVEIMSVSEKTEEAVDESKDEPNVKKKTKTESKS